MQHRTSRCRCAMWVSIGLACMGLASIPAIAAAPGLVVVYPSGQYPADVTSVQQAVINGGTVLLKAVNQSGSPTAFNFGPAAAGSGFVEYQGDLTLLGETVRGQMTRIQGGNLPVRGDYPVRLVVRGIHFDGPRGAGVVIGVSTGVEISKCRFSNVSGFPYFPGAFKGQGIWVNGFPEDTTGQLIIQDNVIENTVANFGYGIALFVFGFEAHVARNVIRGANTAGILVGLNTNKVFIEDNDVEPGPGDGDPNVSIGNGIWVSQPWGGALVIRRNRVRCANPFADGILFFGFAESPIIGLPAPVDNPIVAWNHITMKNSGYGGISLYGEVNNASVDSNLVDGDGAYALQVGQLYLDDLVDLARNNTFIGNSIAPFRAATADVFLDINSVSTAVVGYNGKVIDLGTGDWVSGYTKMAPSPEILQQIRNALAAKHKSHLKMIEAERAARRNSGR